MLVIQMLTLIIQDMLSSKVGILVQQEGMNNVCHVLGNSFSYSGECYFLSLRLVNFGVQLFLCYMI